MKPREREVRQFAIDLLSRLGLKRAPIDPAQIAELKNLPLLKADLPLPVYGALAKIYVTNMTSGNADSLWTKKAKMWQDRFDIEIAALVPTLGDEVRGPPRSIAVSRR